MNSVAVQHIAIGFFSILFLYAIYLAVRGIIRLSKKTKPKIEKIVNDIADEKDWKNSPSYHRSLLELMEAGHPKKQAIAILSERRKIEMLEQTNKQKLQEKIEREEKERLNKSTEGQNDSIVDTIEDEDKEWIEANTIDPENILLADVLTILDCKGRNAAIEFLQGKGYSLDDAQAYVNDYL